MFQKILIDSHRQLQGLKQAGELSEFALIGAFAFARVALPRATADIDYIIQPGSGTLQEIAKSLDGTARIGNISDPLVGTVSYNLPDKHGIIPIQLIQFPKAWEDEALKDIQTETIEQEPLRFVSWRALLLLKLYAGSPIDMQDAQAILDSVSCTEQQYDELVSTTKRLRISKRLERLVRR